MDFQERFATEAACLDYLAGSRWPEGFVCPRCGGRRSWVLERRHLWECADCHQQTSVTAGTVIHGTRTPLRLWFWAAHLVATHHPGISAKQLQRQPLTPRSPGGRQQPEPTGYALGRQCHTGVDRAS